MRLTLLGTGTTSGIPAAGCACPACERARAGTGPARRHTCAWIADHRFAVQIDAGICGPDLPDALLLTHYHPDHVAAIAAVASPGRPVWGPEDPDRRIAVEERVPGLRIRAVEPFAPIALANGWTATPVPMHHTIPALGWLVEGPRRIAWLTDTLGLPERTTAFLAAVRPDLAAIDASFPPADPRAEEKRHNDLPRAVAALAATGCAAGRLIHIGHHAQQILDEGYALPAWCAAGHDGEVIAWT
jgi:phosphoribosyl 1,2-cyclic phosphate phosphodiesterase